MHIAHLVGSLRLGGAEKLTADLALAQRKMGHDITIFTMHEPKAGATDQGLTRNRVGALEEAGVRVLNVGSHTRDLLGAARNIRIQTRHQEFDVAHCHLAVGVAAASCGLRPRPPAIWTLHSTQANFPKWILPMSARLVDEYVAVTPAVAEEFQPYIRRPISTIRNGIPLGAFEGSPRFPKFRPSRFDLVTVGGMREAKNYPRLIRSVAIARASLAMYDCALTLSIVGEGPERHRIEKQVAESHASAYVHLLGARSDVGPILHQADGYVLSSNHEGLPLALLEAMAAGLPVVTTPFQGVTDLVEDRRSAVIASSFDEVDLADAITTIATNVELQIVLSARARSSVLGFDIEECARLYVEKYEEIVNRRSTPESPDGGLQGGS